VDESLALPLFLLLVLLFLLYALALGFLASMFFAQGKKDMNE
ncbi:hypothetical protein A2U01_0088907, partial [Trifolium medium]|nr:hypothetical protein [Trifolium medium]